MVKTFKLVNPFVSGDFNNTFQADTPIKAANSAYKSLSKYFSNNVPLFFFTLQEAQQDGQSGGGDDKSYMHFKVVEDKVKSDGKYNCEYKITSHKVTGGSLQKFKNKIATKAIEARAQAGGHKSRNVTDELAIFSTDDFDLLTIDDSSEPHYRRHRRQNYYTVPRPLTYYWYDPYVYRTRNLYVPTFINNVKPYIELDFYNLF
jgi:hypothetical protein